jgi:hypothetical protein
MAEKTKSQNKPGRNDDRKSGKAPKKHPRKNGAGTTGRTIGGYTPTKLAIREYKRAHGHLPSDD